MMIKQVNYLNLVYADILKRWGLVVDVEHRDCSFYFVCVDSRPRFFTSILGNYGQFVHFVAVSFKVQQVNVRRGDAPSQLVNLKQLLCFLVTV